MRPGLLRDIGDLTFEHLTLVVTAMLIAIAIGVPLGVLLTRSVPLRRPVLGIANILQTIPSLALFGFLIPIPFIGGIGPRTAIVALVIYALLPILRNTLAGILGVDAAVRESAVAMGMTGMQILREVELPLAARTILAGIRVATVTTVGTATIAAAIGGGGLGVFIFRGVASVDTVQILAGAIPAACIALVSDGGLGWIERKLAACLVAASKFLTAGCVAVAAIALLSACSCGKARKPIVVGSKNFTEQVVLGEIIAQHLEHRLTGVKIVRQLNLGGTLLTYNALVNGQIGMYPEYTGTVQAEILKEKPSPDADQSLFRARQELRRLVQVDLIDPLGFNNFFAMVIRGEDARKYKIATLSQAAQVKDGWKLGAGYEFENRIDGMSALSMYRLPMAAAPRSMDMGLMYKAMELGQVTMVAANATDGPLAAHDWTMLTDDQKVFGSYQACVMARQDVLTAEPGLKPALVELSGKIDNDTMRKLNAAVDVHHRQVREVAADFLRQAGLAASGAK